MIRFLSGILAAIALFAFVFLSAGPAEAGETNGPKLFAKTHKCNMCHPVAAADIQAKSTAMNAKDLSGYQPKTDFASLAAFLRKEQSIQGSKHKKGFKGSDEELQAIVDWLGSLEAQ